jgi:hypothetical protein
VHFFACFCLCQISDFASAPCPLGNLSIKVLWCAESHGGGATARKLVCLNLLTPVLSLFENFVSVHLPTAFSTPETVLYYICHVFQAGGVSVRGHLSVMIKNTLKQRFYWTPTRAGIHCLELFNMPLVYLDDMGDDVGDFWCVYREFNTNSGHFHSGHHT